MINDIIVSLSVGKARDVAGEFAISAARLFNAHLSAVAFVYDPVVAMPLSDGFGPPIMDTWRASRREAAAKAKAAFDTRAGVEGIAFDSRIVADETVETARQFGHLARHHDLSIVGQAKSDDDYPESMVIEAALFDSGRPVIIVPYSHRRDFACDRVMVCWDGSRPAARAVADALPILKRAKSVEVVTIDQKENRNALVGSDIAQHLARHKVKVELRPIIAPDIDVPNAILSHASDASTDLIVMGGYGHSRLREFMLGGATRGILESMTVPVLMAH